MKKCVDIVVTYNRKKLLEENVNALLNQTYHDHDIMIIDNASTDGTDKMLKKYQDKILYYNTRENLGGAGGFAYGLKKAIQSGYEYAWIMDDDSVPSSNALESLIEKATLIDNHFSFMASLVYWTDGDIFPMNLPNFQDREINYKNLKYISQLRMIPISHCSFVGCFINLKSMYQYGLPISEFFIYGDDSEYTKRLRKHEIAYLDLDSIIVHKAPHKLGADVATADISRISRFYYQARNGIYISRKNHQLLSYCLLIVKRSMRILLKAPNHRMKRIYVLFKGGISGFFFNPEIEYVEYGSKEKQDNHRKRREK